MLSFRRNSCDLFWQALTLPLFTAGLWNVAEIALGPGRCVLLVQFPFNKVKSFENCYSSSVVWVAQFWQAAQTPEPSHRGWVPGIVNQQHPGGSTGSLSTRCRGAEHWARGGGHREADHLQGQKNGSLSLHVTLSTVTLHVSAAEKAQYLLLLSAVN